MEGMKDIVFAGFFFVFFLSLASLMAYGNLSCTAWVRPLADSSVNEKGCRGSIEVKGEHVICTCPNK